MNRLRADLTLKNPDFESAVKYGKGFVSYSIPEFIYMYLMDEDYIGLPRSIKQTYLLNKFEQCGIKLNLVDKRPIFETIEVGLKEGKQPLFYQVDAIQKIVDGNVILKFRCGMGKTVIALMAVAQIKLRTLIIVRTNVILTQWVDAIKQYLVFDEKDIGIINQDSKIEGKITIATEQSLVAFSRDEKRRLGEIYGHVIVDECHEIGAGQYRDLVTFFKARKITGLTATPNRDDGLTIVLKLFIVQIVEVDDIGESNLRIKIVKTKFNFQFDKKTQQYNKLLEHLSEDFDRNQLIIDEIKTFLEQDRIIVCYSSRVKHMEILNDMLVSQVPNVKSDILANERYGKKVSITEQNNIKNKLVNGEIQVLFGGKIVEQGFDCPILSTVILATPTRSLRLVEQVIGRCQREYKGKQVPVFVDFFDENTDILKYQFFTKSRKIYSNYEKV